MAGTLFGLPLSQPVDLNGKPQTGCKLYIYAAGSFTTPATAYKDDALTVGQEHPFPIPSDAWGRLPIFWLDDGSYAFRLVDRDGVVLASSLTVLALGPSSGGGGGGGSVDPNALIQTGDVLWQDAQGTRAGFVRDNARTIGSATSGATERANIDVEALYTYLWTTFSNTFCPVSGGRGASAAADFAANKPIALPDKRGYVPGGLDDMGNSAAGRFVGVPVLLGSVTDPGSVIGETLNTLTSAQIPAHTHSITDVAHSHTVPIGGDNAGGKFGVNNSSLPVTSSSTTDSVMTGITGTNANTGGGGAHNNVQQTVLGTFYRKL